MLNCSLEKGCELFFTDRDTYCSDCSVDNYRNTLRYFTNFMVDRRECEANVINVEEIDLFDLNAYSIFLKNKNKTIFNSVSDEKISPRTRKDYLKDVRAFFNYLEQNGYITVNPANKMKLPRVLPQPIEPLTNDEVDILDACYGGSAAYSIRNLAIIHCLLDEGMRSGEVQRMKLEDLHFDESYIAIRYSKGGKGRILPMAVKVKALLQQYIEDKRPDVSHSYVFCTNSGDPLTADSIKNMFSRLKLKSGIVRIYPHLFRHTFGTSFILGGGNVELLRVYMGHSSIETTQKYLHVANNMRFCQNVYRLDPIFLKKFY